MTGELSVRPYQTDDAEALSALYEASVRALGARDYSAAQIEAWASLTPSPEALDGRMADGRTRLVAVADDIAGFIDLEPDGHIDLLYVAPAAAGAGVARLLLETAEALAPLSGAGRLYAEASETARPVFERLGYSVTGRRDFEVAGEPIHNWAVEKAL
ncbi:GNAT family N-acetyltransferase [Roseibacterium beibuensis]|uniref:GNAT family N-acetyltransferase n=1 Tax=[Roseibacterium] beibuensis TaxID=1193142 RepID=UPI00217DD399|nr:GNAT family N-acetyltransferase [Roseibacterium beibuensis]MCS6624872.1 GNAT family N-acetyltransferase [Roseibacterium beibuensis]